MAAAKGIIDKTFSISVGLLTGGQETLNTTVIQGQDLITAGFGPPDVQEFTQFLGVFLSQIAALRKILSHMVEFPNISIKVWMFHSREREDEVGARSPLSTPGDK